MAPNLADHTSQTSSCSFHLTRPTSALLCSALLLVAQYGLERSLRLFPLQMVAGKLIRCSGTW